MVASAGSGGNLLDGSITRPVAHRPLRTVRNRAAITLKSISGYENLDYDFLLVEEDRLQAKEKVMQG